MSSQSDKVTEVTKNIIRDARLQAVWEGVKEFLRLALIAAVTSVLAVAQSYVTGITDPTVNIIAVTIVAFLVKAWDKKVHEDKTTTRNGIVPF